MTPDWNAIFIPQGSLLELVVRGTIMYLAIFFAFRFFRRSAGGLGVADLLLVVLVADAAQNGMAGEYRSVPEGIVIVATIVFWDFAIDWLDFHVPALRPLLGGKPVLLIKNGRVLYRNLRSELITVGDLKAQLREEGVREISQVERAYLETDGKLSVVRFAAGDSSDR